MWALPLIPLCSRPSTGMSSHLVAVPENALVCEQCGSNEDVSFEPDPFDWSVNGDPTPHNLCAECLDRASEDI